MPNRAISQITGSAHASLRVSRINKNARRRRNTGLHHRCDRGRYDEDGGRGIRFNDLGKARYGDLIKGAGGARNVRVAGRGKGKSGGYRVITFFAAKDVPVFLLDCYGKGDRANLTKTERNDLRQMLGGIVEAYRRGSSASAEERT